MAVLGCVLLVGPLGTGASVPVLNPSQYLDDLYRKPVPPGGASPAEVNSVPAIVLECGPIRLWKTTLKDLATLSGSNPRKLFPGESSPTGACFYFPDKLAALSVEAWPQDKDYVNAYGLVEIGSDIALVPECIESVGKLKYDDLAIKIGDSPPLVASRLGTSTLPPSDGVRVYTYRAQEARGRASASATLKVLVQFRRGRLVAYHVEYWPRRE